jgi:DNA-binding CsgD family transcriptional regulator
MQIIWLIADGKCDKEIARALGISGYTVREHVRRTCAKLGCSAVPPSFRSSCGR